MIPWQVLNAPRPGKKLAVLDLEQTLLDTTGNYEQTSDSIIRPHLLDLLASIYEDFDIMIWSGSSFRW